MRAGKAIGKIVGIGALAAVSVAAYMNYAAYKKSEDKVKRLDSYYHMCCAWIRDKQNDVNLKSVFDEMGSRKVAIYGMGVLGNLFYNELKSAGVCCVAFIDKNKQIMGCGIDDMPLFSSDEINISGADTVVVTPAFAFDGIKKELEEYSSDIKIVSLDEIYTA